MSFESIQKYIDPVISEILDKAVDNKEITISEVLELLDCKGMEMNMLIAVANYIRKNKNGDVVTYVLNRNINFTNVCIKRCGFCAFSRDFRQEEGYFLPTEEVVKRSKEAYQYGATEVCIQAGLPPQMDGNLYVELCKSIKRNSQYSYSCFFAREIMYGPSFKYFSKRISK
jgi:FO synthase subunit 2